MTAPHIRRRQQMAVAAKINAEGKAAPPYVDPYDAPQKPIDAMMKQAQAHFDNEPDQPGDDDPLAGLGLRAGDLEAVRDQIMDIVRPLQREHYRALFMAAVIQGAFASGNVDSSACGEGFMLDQAEAVADGALIRMGL